MRQGFFTSLLWAAAALAAVAPALGQDAGLPSGAPAVIVEGSGNVSAAGQPAARKGDAADNGQVIVEGSKDVFINGRPAVTVGDRTGCSGVTVGGASNVFINGKPMARSGDLTTGCPGK
ncbi:MAG: PAAR domain-containing protein [Rhodomicrobium sp.]